MKPEKPPFMHDCNGCGYCCTKQPCEVAQEFLGCSQGPCVALEVEEERTFCGMVRHPLLHLWNAANPDKKEEWKGSGEPQAGADLSTRIAYMLRLGAGCDAMDEPSVL